MTVITVARQLGSFGDWIAEQLAAKLDYAFVDRRLVEEIAQHHRYLGRRGRALRRKGGRAGSSSSSRNCSCPKSLRGLFPYRLPHTHPSLGSNFPHMRDYEVGEATYLDRGTYQLLITTLVQEFGQDGKAVIVGRASQVILADHPKGLPRQDHRPARNAD